MWKALSVIAAILAAGAAFMSYLNKGDAEQERNLLKTAENNLKDIDARFVEVKKEQEVFASKNTKMEERRDTALEEQEAEKQKLEAKTQEVMDTNERIKELEMEIAKAKSQIAEFGNIKQLMALIDQLEGDLAKTREQIVALSGELDSSTAQHVAATKKIQEFKDLEFRQRNGQMKSINASITSVYNNWGFVVLGAGDRQGVVSRTRLDVNRGGDKIAELVVTNLEKNRSVCDIVPGSMEPGQILRPGDSVSVNAESLPKPPKAVADVPGTGINDGGAAPGPANPGVPVEQPVMPADPAPGGDPLDPFADLESPSTPETPTAPTEPKKPSDDPFDDL